MKIRGWRIGTKQFDDSLFRLFKTPALKAIASDSSSDLESQH
jgi:hypothetical protein